MGNIRHSNNASATLASGIGTGDTSITVSSGQGALFPTVGGGLYATLAIESAAGAIEIVRLTARSGDVLTVTRAQEGTIATAFSSGARIENRVTAATLNDFFQKAGDNITGDVTVNTTMFTIAAATGNTVIAGTLNVGGASTFAAVSGTSGTFSTTLSVTGVATFGNALRGVLGSNTTPTYSFTGDTNTGMYSTGADEIAFALGGADVLVLETVQVGALVPFRADNGTAGTPSYSFTNDPTTGFYRPATSELWYSEGGTGLRIGSRIIPQNSQSGNYTCVANDSGGHILHPNGAGASDTFTIPSNASVPYPVGTAIMFVNRDSNNLTIGITSDSMFIDGTTTGGAGVSRTLGQNGKATAVKVEATVWLIGGSGLT